MVIKILVLIGIIGIISFLTKVEMEMRDTTMDNAFEIAPITTILKTIFYIYLMWVWIGTWC
jgi:hypothetical protein